MHIRMQHPELLENKLKNAVPAVLSKLCGIFPSIQPNLWYMLRKRW